MPIYEYYCYDCRRRVSVFWRSISAAEKSAPVCPLCGGKHLRRLVSRVAVAQSEEDRLERLADPSNLSGLDPDDPKSMARWMRQMGQEMGEDLGDEFDEVIDRMEAGEDPDEIERSLGGGEDSFVPPPG